MATIWKSEYFYGNKISDYGLQEGYVDYATLSKCFQAVLCDNQLLMDYDFEQVGGFEDYYDEIEDLRWRIATLEDDKTEVEEILEDLSEEARRTTRPDFWARIQGQQEECQARLFDINDKIEELQGEIEDLEDAMNYEPEIYQYYIVSDNAVDILALNDEIVYYIETLNMYIWGVTHLGTSWDYVLTNIKIELD